MDIKNQGDMKDTSANNKQEPAKENESGQIDQSKKTPEGSPRGARAARTTRGRPRARRPEESGSEFIEKVIKINRVAKVTKGGKKLSFSALVVVGDGKGHAGYDLGKANDVASAIRKALTTAKKNMIKIPMKGSTITHEIIGLCGAARVLLKPASDGTGVIAAGPVRAVCDAAGIRNILTKCHTTNNPLNVVKATINGFGRLKSPREESPSSESQ